MKVNDAKVYLALALMMRMPQVDIRACCEKSKEYFPYLISNFPECFEDIWDYKDKVKKKSKKIDG